MIARALQILLLAVLVVSTALVLHHNFDLVIASRGETIIGWIYHQVLPENFIHDYPSLVTLYGQTLTAYPYLIAYRMWGVTPESMLPYFMVSEVFVLAVATIALVRSVLERRHPWIELLTVVLMVSGNIRVMNFARFEQPFFFGVYYSYADAFRIGAIAALFSRRYFYIGPLLALSFCCHPILALDASFFVAAIFFVRWIEDKKRFPLPLLVASIGIGAVMAAGWIALTYSGSHPVSNIPIDAWFKLSQMGSYHWYPVTLRLFSERYWEVAIPFGAFSLLLFEAWGRLSEKRARELMCAYAIVMLLVAIGVANSVFHWNVTLTKVALHRANDVLLTVGVVFIVWLLWDEITNSPMLRKAVALVLLVSPILTRPGLPLFWVMSLVVLRKREPKARIVIAAQLVVSVTLLIFLISLISRGIVIDWQGSAFAGGIDFLYRACWLSIVAIVFSFRPLSHALSVATVVAVFVCVVWLQQRLYELNPYLPGDPELAASYEEVQLWARDHTAADALFVPDPAMQYGWRDISRRSSFGIPRDWLFTSWQYDGDVKIFDRGMERLADYGVTIDLAYLNPDKATYRNLEAAASDKYYAGDSEWARKLTAKYGINYFVLKKNLLRKPYDYPIVFENDVYRVYRVDGEGA